MWRFRTAGDQGFPEFRAWSLGSVYVSTPLPTNEDSKVGLTPAVSATTGFEQVGV